MLKSYGWILIIFLLIFFHQSCRADEKKSAVPLDQMSYFQSAYPRLIYFRNIERAAVESDSFEKIEPFLKIYDAAVTKAFDEEKYGLSEYAIPYLRKLKQRNPNFLLILHFSGISCDPRAGCSSFPGCWLHRVGCLITSDMPAQSGVSEITVEDPNLFSMAVGKKNKYPDNMTICALNKDGTPNWLISEYVKLVGIDAKNKRLKVERGFLNSKPKLWKAGQTYIAPVASHGRWPLLKNNSKDEPLNCWRYNYSLDAPADAKGRRLVDLLSEDLAAKLKPGGPGDFFDGVTFDVMPFFLSKRDAGQDNENKGFKDFFGYYDNWDTNGDGKKDSEDQNGIDSFAAGVSQFCHWLREALGPNKLIMMDSGRRANRVMNGIESEGWPAYTDMELNQWSSGMNFHRFWATRRAEPQVRYIHRYGMPPNIGRDKSKIKRDYHRARLIMAAAQLLGSALVTQQNPQPEQGELFGCFDELKMGVEHRYHWLGMPREDTRQLAMKTCDLLKGEGVKMSISFQKKLSSKDADISIIKNSSPALKFKAKNSDAKQFSVIVSDLPVCSPDMVIALRIKADPMRGMEADVARRVTIKLADKIKSPTTPKSLWTWADGDWFEATFYFRGLKTKNANLIINVEDSPAIYITDLRVYNYPDVMCREFDNGLVLANPGLTSFKFNLASLYPSDAFRRIKGSIKQDPNTNTGLAVGDYVTVGPRDGLFLVRKH